MNNTVGAASALDDSPGLLRMVQTFGRTVGTDDIAVAASLLFQAWAVNVTRPAIAGLVGARRVTDPGADNTELLFDEEGRPVGASATTPRYAALPGDDEAVADPWAEIVPDEDALFAWVRSRLYEGHLAPLVDALVGIALPLAAHAASVGGAPPVPRLGRRKRRPWPPSRRLSFPPPIVPRRCSTTPADCCMSRVRPSRDWPTCSRSTTTAVSACSSGARRVASATACPTRRTRASRAA